MNYTLAALWLIFCVGVVVGLHAFTVVDRNRRARRHAIREDDANEERWATPQDEARALADDVLRRRAMHVVAEGDDYGYATRRNYLEVLRIAAESDSAFPYYAAVCQVIARREAERIDDEWKEAQP